MNPLYIIEGPDSSGKTTLAKFICRVRRAAYYHASGHRSLHAGMVAYHRSILQQVENTLEISNLPVVLDRHWPSEQCYGAALRPDAHDSIHYPAGEFFSTIKRLGGLYIFCFSEQSSTRQAEHPDPDHPYTREQYQRILKEYESLSLSMRSEDCVRFYSIEEHGHDMGKFVQEVIP